MLLIILLILVINNFLPPQNFPLADAWPVHHCDFWPIWNWNLFYRQPISRRSKNARHQRDLRATFNLSAGLWLQLWILPINAARFWCKNTLQLKTDILGVILKLPLLLFLSKPVLQVIGNSWNKHFFIIANNHCKHHCKLSWNIYPSLSLATAMDTLCIYSSYFALYLWEREFSLYFCRP